MKSLCVCLWCWYAEHLKQIHQPLVQSIKLLTCGTWRERCFTEICTKFHYVILGCICSFILMQLPVSFAVGIFTVLEKRRWFYLPFSFFIFLVLEKWNFSYLCFVEHPGMDFLGWATNLDVWAESNFRLWQNVLPRCSEVQDRTRIQRLIRRYPSTSGFAVEVQVVRDLKRRVKFSLSQKLRLQKFMTFRKNKDPWKIKNSTELIKWRFKA